MSELTQMVRFYPKTIKDEGRIYRATPVTITDSSALLINEYGFSLCKTDHEAIPLDIPDADEVILTSDARICACWFDGGCFRVQEYRFEAEAFHPDGEPCIVDIQDLDSDDLIVLGVDGGVELWLDTAKLCQRIWTVSNGSGKKEIATVASRPDGELLFSSGKMVTFAEDLGVRGSYLNVVDLVTQMTWRVRSTYSFAALGRVFSITDSDPTVDNHQHGLYVFAEGKKSFLETDGPVIEAGGNSNRAVLSVFTGKDTKLRGITEGENGRLSVHHIDAPEGYKALSPDGELYIVRGFKDALTIAPTPSMQSQLSQPTHPSATSSTYSISDEYVVSRALGKTIGAVIHFHGGPEGYEVPESRLFGLPQWCNSHGLDWIGVNYQGSLMPDPAYTRSAWHRWQSTLQEDFSGALKLTSGPLVLAGWSFGAAISLALGASSERVRGLLLGATMGDLVKHVNHAMTIDSTHYDWFTRRFDLTGSDANFFNGVNGFTTNVQVLEMHGVDDMNCPVQLANELAEQWEERQNPWERVWLPGGGHFATILEDIEIIAESSRKFLTNVLLEAL
ncbi:hypothetical protein [Canibacter zhoujuaniae]|uniref:hypothetical protein n=1 Tax=Canibacter zhoujuaniae TaxID=2708343 RepID=UPI00141F6C31|nr:hypothetical protein [Canibacter zhoujuaniae]